MISVTSILTHWRAVLLAGALLALVAVGQALAALAVLGLAGLALRIARGADNAGRFQPPLVQRSAALHPGGHDPMSSNLWQPAPLPSRPMGPPGADRRP